MIEMTSNGQPRLVVVVVTHNGGPWLKKCLAGLARQTYSNHEVIVVDSGSGTPPTGTVAKMLPGGELIVVERNLGFGTACNYALGASRKTASAEYFLFLHDDVQLERQAISVLVETAVKTGAGIVGGKGLDWERPEVLVEVGMSADQFCIPFSGLEKGEIDQGQHEGLRETLFVSNACMLVSRDVAMRCGLWDGAYFAFGEDLDLCLRSRLAGFKVMVQPAARFRHVAALSNGLRRSPVPPRLLRRRNQLRTITKNFHLFRILPLLAVCVVVGGLRMLLLVAFRRFDDGADYARALAHFVRTLPDVLRRRRAVQKRRVVPDRRVRRYMVSDAHRARAHLENRIRHLDRGSLTFGARKVSGFSMSALGGKLAGWLRRPAGASVLVISLILTLALRRVIFGPPIAAGSVWPFPPAATLLTDYVAQWRDIRLGSHAAAPPALPILWVVSVLGLGNAALAQKLLVVLLLAVGLVGISRLAGRSAPGAPARIAAMAIYALGPVVPLMMSTGDLTAMAMYAGLPFILIIALRIVDPGEANSHPGEGDPHDALVRDAARLGLLVVPVVALGPSNLIALIFLFTLLGIYRFLSGRRTEPGLQGVGYLALGIGLGALGLIPWIFEGLRDNGAILGPLFSGRGGPFRGLWGGGFEEALLLNVDRRVGGLVALAAALGALMLAGPSRRQESRMLATAWFGFAIVGGLAAKAVISPPVVSRVAWMVVPLAVVAALTGHVVAGLQEELPRHSFGWRHRLATPAIVLM
ncbi:MAG: glycosyltransferase family 2 protein, partial [Actinomycetota bacterium]|nr:glycosyltransferase family 2 protein [Actinomycetota bacterium]